MLIKSSSLLISKSIGSAHLIKCLSYNALSSSLSPVLISRKCLTQRLLAAAAAAGTSTSQHGRLVHVGSQLRANDEKSGDKQQTTQPDKQKKFSINSTLNIPIKSALGDDLKNIIGNQTDTSSADDKKTTAQKQQQEKSAESNNNAGDQNEQPKGRFSKMFSKEHAWKVSLAFFVAMFGGSFLYVLVEWGAPLVDENKNIIKDEFSNLPIIIQYPKRAIHTAFAYYEMMKNPSTEKLLPDPVQYPYYQPPYTLVIEMTGIMLHPEWTFSTGWRYKKRPGLDYFIDQIKYPMFEVVLFTREPFLAGSPITASLDPQGQIQFKLFRESTKFIDNKHVKDLTFMNRDLSKIIVIDWDEASYSMQPRNALHRLKKWEGDETDADLVYLASFLKMLASSGVQDVREVLDYYNKELSPLDTFKENQVKLQIAEQERLQEIERLKEKKKGFSLFKR